MSFNVIVCLSVLIKEAAYEIYFEQAKIETFAYSLSNENNNDLTKYLRFENLRCKKETKLPLFSI